MLVWKPYMVIHESSVQNTFSSVNPRYDSSWYMGP